MSYWIPRAKVPVLKLTLFLPASSKHSANYRPRRKGFWWHFWQGFSAGIYHSTVHLLAFDVPILLHNRSQSGQYTNFPCPPGRVKDSQCKDLDLSFVPCSPVSFASLFLDRNAFSDWAYFAPISEIELCCQVPLPHKCSQSTWKNKGMEQRTNLFQVTSPRAQLLTLQQWIVVWFSSFILCRRKRE